MNNDIEELKRGESRSNAATESGYDIMQQYNEHDEEDDVLSLNTSMERQTATEFESHG